MLQRKKKEQIHLYKAMKKRAQTDNEVEQNDNEDEQDVQETPDNAPKAAPKNFVLVGRDTELFNEFKEHLETNGDQVTCFTSGKAYLTKRKQVGADITFFCMKTDDVDFAHIFPRCKGTSGKMVFVIYQSEQKFLKFLFSKINPRELVGVLKLPSEHSVIDDQISNWMKF